METIKAFYRAHVQNWVRRQKSRIAWQMPLSTAPNLYARSTPNASFDSLLREYAEKAKSGALNEFMRTFRDKLRSRQWIVEHAPVARVPETSEPFDSVSEVDFSVLPDRFVLKPLRASNARGVFCLERLSTDYYYDVARAECLTTREICERYEAERAASRVSYSEVVIIEERVEDAVVDGLPIDYKFHCFRGYSPMVMQRYVPAGGKYHDYKFRFLDRDWNDLGPIKFADRHSTDLPQPPLWREAFEAAEAISARIDFPFMRIDLYVTPTEIVFGEFTPFPNGGVDYFTPGWDRRLGQIWQAAERRRPGRSRTLLRLKQR